MSRNRNPPDRPLRLLVVAGEESGDIHAAGLLEAIRDKVPDTEFYGIGGKRLSNLGLRAIASVEEMHVTGFLEVVSRYRFLRSVFTEVKKRARADHPDAALLVDYPGFNLKLAPYLSKLQIPVFYYVAPQLWAWHESRVKIMKTAVDRLVVLFPFEVEFFARHGVDAEWYGHPLAHRLAEEASERRERASQTFSTGAKPIIAYLPGSRESELKHHVRPMVDIAEKLGSSYRHVAGIAPTVSEELARSEAGSPSVAFEYSHDTEALLEAASVAVVKSGTANLVAALTGTPFVSVYKTSPLSYAIGKRLAKVSAISIVNILARQNVVPEFVQKAFRPDTVAPEIDRLLHDEAGRIAMKAQFAQIAAELDRPSAYASAAASMMDMISAG